MLHGENLKPSQLLSPALSYYAGERGAGCFAPVLTSVRSLAGRPRGARRRKGEGENGRRAAGDAKGSENDVY